MTKGTTGNVNEGKDRDGMAFQVGVDSSQGEELFLLHETVVGPDGVKDRGSMTLGEDESVRSEVLGVLRFIMHTRFVEMEDGEELSS